MFNYIAMGYEYGSDFESYQVFQRLLDSEVQDAAFFRCCDPDKADCWYIIGISLDKVFFDWGSGVPFEPSTEQIEWMKKRRMTRGLQAIVNGEDKVRDVKRYKAGDMKAPHHG